MEGEDPDGRNWGPPLRGGMVQVAMVMVLNACIPNSVSWLLNQLPPPVLLLLLYYTRVYQEG